MNKSILLTKAHELLSQLMQATTGGGHEPFVQPTTPQYESNSTNSNQGCCGNALKMEYQRRILHLFIPNRVVETTFNQTRVETNELS